MRNRRPFITVALWAVSGCLLFLAGTLLREHAVAVRSVRADALPLVTEIPQLERRARVLAEQRELAELSDALRIGSPEERMRVYALPTEPDLDKTVSALDVLFRSLRASARLSSFSPVTFGNVEDAGGGLRRTPVRTTLGIHEEGLDALIAFIQLCGSLSIADALTDSERLQLLRLTEMESPTAIVALEQYLNADLLSYIEEPRSADAQLLRSFSSQSFERSLRDILRTSALPTMRRAVSPAMAQTLRSSKIWPMQMMQIDALTLDAGGAPGWYKASVELGLYTRQ
ncbi:hypothetical protein FJZ27_01745 [Candidatus Peribacteria bacterium]|nr:hypothetical protein [Candidatus Peribacteria bacterium]